MSVVLGLLGIAIIVFTLRDVLITTLAANRGAGPLTARVGNWLWQAILKAHRASPRHRLLSIAGVAIVIVIVSLWALLMLTGWSLIFSASGAAIVNTQTGEPADFWSRVYYAGFSLITLGTGDFRPQGAFWQLATVLAAANGFFLVTLTITYLAPVISAVTEQRQAASVILSLGRNPHDLLASAWNGKDFSSLTQPFLLLVPTLALYGQRHLAFPVLSYFHSATRRTAISVGIAVLFEVLVVLEGVEEACRPDPLAMQSLRLTLTDAFETLNPSFIEPADRTPPPPQLARLRAKGIPTVSDEAFGEVLEGLARQRRLVLALLQNDGWAWASVYGQEDETPERA